MSRNESIKFVVVRSFGNFLLLLSLYGVVITFGPVISAETQFRWKQAMGVRYVVADVGKERNEKEVESGAGGSLSATPITSPILEKSLPNNNQLLVPKDPLFSILIPKIGANAKVSPNIDPTNTQEFLPVLREGIAHAKGSVFPSMQGNIYLFAHSATTWWEAGQYNAVFYLIKDLEAGDEVVVFFENKRYDYVVTQRVISGAEDTSFLSREQTGEERLVLQTCWPPGTSWKRLYIVAEPKR